MNVSKALKIPKINCLSNNKRMIPGSFTEPIVLVEHGSGSTSHVVIGHIVKEVAV